MFYNKNRMCDSRVVKRERKARGKIRGGPKKTWNAILKRRGVTVTLAIDKREMVSTGSVVYYVRAMCCQWCDVTVMLLRFIMISVKFRKENVCSFLFSNCERPQHREVERLVD